MLPLQLKKLYRKLYWLPKDLRWKIQLRGIDELVHFGDRGIGDDLLCTAVLHEMHKRGRAKVAMMTNWPELFENLPSPAKVIPWDYGALHCIERAGIKTWRPTYAKVAEESPLRFSFAPGHLIEAMCRSVGIEGDVENRPHVWLTDTEKGKWSSLQQSLVVQTSRANPRFALPNKEWYPARWHKLGALLRKFTRVVQVGSKEDPLLEGADDLRGSTSLRDVAAILWNARLFLGLEGFLMHLARAVDTRAVIIFGGYIHPSCSGYPENSNLFTELACSPCGYPVHCDFDRECMKRILPEDVLAAVVEAWEMPRLTKRA